MTREELPTVKIGDEVKRFFTDGYDYITVTEIELSTGLIMGTYADGKPATWFFSYCELL